MQRAKLKIFIFLAPILFLTCDSYAELRNNQSADLVIGQPNFTSNSINPAGRETLYRPVGIFTDGRRLLISDFENNRVLIYNSIPTSNNASADVVIGQSDFTSNSINQGLGPLACGANTLYGPTNAFFDGQKLFIADQHNHRILIYNSIPTSNNASADVVIGQSDFTSNSINQGLGPLACGANTLHRPYSAISIDKRLFIADYRNSRVLVYNSIPTSNNASADVVMGQANFTSNQINQTGSTTAAGPNTFYWPLWTYSDGKRLFIADYQNHRVLVFNSEPIANNANADVVIGQPDFTTNTSGTAANKLDLPESLFLDGKRLFIADSTNNRLLIYTSIPTQNNAAADIVIGQPDFTSNSVNQGGSPAANTLYTPYAVFGDGKRLFVADYQNHRVLIYNIGSPSIQLGPQFDQGKAVLGKVFEDKNANAVQDKEEVGLEGVKVASDTGIYAITDSDGKFHFPYIETGQHLLKIDPVTLAEGSIITSPNPQRVIVTEGVLTKVSFGVKLPEESLNTLQPTENGPLLKVSISQDPMLLKPKLSVSTTQDKDDLIFNIGCNYYLFIEKAKLALYNQDYKLLKTIDLPAQPLPSKYILALKELPSALSYYYQLSVYDKQGREDRTGMGSVEIK